MAKRRKLFVDRAVQGALLRRVALHWAFYFTGLVIVLGIFYVLKSLATSEPMSVNEFFQNHMITFTVLLALVPVFLYDTLKLSHRFAGPIVRLRNGLSAWGDGEEVKPIKFRQNDFWNELADHFNRAVERTQRESPEQDSSAAHETISEPVEVGV
jgi:hypothetical protein